jgi:hypothetical protein
MSAQLIVKATVLEAGDRQAFDCWYAAIHMPDAVAAFQPFRSWRSWSTIDPAVHYACYEFSDVARLRDVMETDSFAVMVADFTRRWEGKVTRVRDVVEVVEMNHNNGSGAQGK